jgi:beta-glucuronidase
MGPWGRLPVTTSRCSWYAGDTVVDSYHQSVGVRTAKVDGIRFLINGEPFYFTGFGKHEDLPVIGKGHSDAYLVHDFELLKWIGANSFRTSHYPYSEDVLDYADRQGIVIIDETAAVGLNMSLITKSAAAVTIVTVPLLITLGAISIRRS